MLTKRRCWSHCIAKCERWAAALTWNLIELNLSLWLPCAESFGSQNTSYEQAMHLGLWTMQSLKGPLPQSSKLIWLHCLDQVCVWSGCRLSDKNSCCSFVVLRSLSILHPLFLHQHYALLDFVSTVGLWVTMSLSLNILKPTLWIFSQRVFMAIHYQNVNMMTVERCYYANTKRYWAIILISL